MAVKGAKSHRTITNEVRWGQRYIHLQQRLFRHIDFTLKFLSLALSANAFVSVIGEKGILASISVALVALCTILDALTAPGVKAHKCEVLVERYGELLTRANGLSNIELETELHKLRQMPSPGVEALRVPALNDVVTELGEPEYLMKASLWSRFIALLA